MAAPRLRECKHTATSFSPEVTSRHEHLYRRLGRDAAAPLPLLWAPERLGPGAAAFGGGGVGTGAGGLGIMPLVPQLRRNCGI